MGEVEAKLRLLMIAGLAGDARAYRQLLASAAERLRRYFARRLGPDHMEIEDLVQDTLMAIHQRRDSYNRALPFSVWLHAIARYKLIDHFRRQGVRKPVPIEDFEDFADEDRLAPALAAFDVRQLIAGLPERHRRAIQLTHIEGHSVAEAAALTGQSESAIKIGVHRGLKRLKALVGGSQAE